MEYITIILISALLGFCISHYIYLKYEKPIEKPCNQFLPLRFIASDNNIVQSYITSLTINEEDKLIDLFTHKQEKKAFNIIIKGLGGSYDGFNPNKDSFTITLFDGIRVYTYTK